jgi:hypothetical protein
MARLSRSLAIQTYLIYRLSNRNDNRSWTWSDYWEVGGHRKVKGPILRGLASRAPTVTMVLPRRWRTSSFYEMRFNIVFTLGKADLIAF